MKALIIRSDSDRGVENFTVKAFNFLNKLGILKRYRPMPTEILAKKNVINCTQVP
ncbi:hypothetical protein [Capnocytophaga sp. oral taxon 336]|uniref:hypothetical protein n=1 Tax=Capnocytophaga sp. oral taxon 336 TaxID=712216 RepID=UPI00034E4168|nr:hypothetical protein [Capnocytophaga sp. oral taxon 336]EPE00510.1 hypothetical protein HMPREF1528_00952 [Capnocytophaga sp. oral taxon 336 str. F0502]